MTEKPETWRLVDGIVRWESNGAVPFDDVLRDLWQRGEITGDVMAASSGTKILETAAFLHEYRRLHANRVRSAEELFEMRAAFGAGAEVVDVITGQVTKL